MFKNYKTKVELREERDHYRSLWRGRQDLLGEIREVMDTLGGLRSTNRERQAQIVRLRELCAQRVDDDDTE